MSTRSTRERFNAAALEPVQSRTLDQKRQESAAAQRRLLTS
jgi:hypothetical protein